MYCISNGFKLAIAKKKNKSTFDGCVLFQGVPVQVLTSTLKASSMVDQVMQKGEFNMCRLLLGSYSMQQLSATLCLRGHLVNNTRTISEGNW